MKIGLIAPEFNGKTSYLVGLYTVLVHDRSMEPKYPFQFSIKDPKQRHWLGAQFANLIDESLPLFNKENPGNQRFPAKTSEALTNYVITVRDRASSFTEEVTLVDFPGGIIRGAMSEGQRDLHDKTIEQLSRCDAFIVLLDSTALLNRGRYYAKQSLSPSDIEPIMLAAIESARERDYTNIGVPIAFCMSKADKVASLYADQPDLRETAFQRVIDLFPSFFEEEHRHPVLITAVTLGENIENPSVPGSGLGGPFEPFLIEKPFEFCVAFGALSAMTARRRAADQWDSVARREEASRHRASSLGAIDTVVEWFKTPADFGQTPEEYWTAQRDISRKISSGTAEQASNFKKIVRSFLEDLRGSTEEPLHSIYLGGKLHTIGDEIEPGELPLVPVD